MATPRPTREILQSKGTATRLNQEENVQRELGFQTKTLKNGFSETMRSSSLSTNIATDSEKENTLARDQDDATPVAAREQTGNRGAHERPALKLPLELQIAGHLREQRIKITKYDYPFSNQPDAIEELQN